MKVANWTAADKENYELPKIKEAYKVEEDKNIYQKGFSEGEIKASIKASINQVKMLKDMEKNGISIPTKYYDQVKYSDQILSYFDTHPNYAEESESQILGAMDIDYGTHQ